MNVVVSFILLFFMGVSIFAIGYTSCEIRWCSTMKKTCEWWRARIDTSSIDYNDGVCDTLSKIQDLRYMKGE